MKTIDQKRWQEHKSASLLFDAATELKLHPKWLTEYGLFSIEVATDKKYVFYSQTGLNSQLAAYLTKNKHICRVVLEENNFENIPFFLPASTEDVLNFQNKYGKVIAKPTTGQRSEGVIMVENIEQAKKVTFEERILEKYVHGVEIRYLFLNGKVIAVQERKIKATPGNPWNKERHSVQKKLWVKKLVQTSLEAAKVFDLKFGCVDYIIDEQNTAWILEVNCAPALWPFHNPISGPAINVSKMLLEATVKKV